MTCAGIRLASERFFELGWIGMDYITCDVREGFGLVSPDPNHFDYAQWVLATCILNSVNVVFPASDLEVLSLYDELDKFTMHGIYIVAGGSMSDFAWKSNIVKGIHFNKGLVKTRPMVKLFSQFGTSERDWIRDRLVKTNKSFYLKPPFGSGGRGVRHIVCDDQFDPETCKPNQISYSMLVAQMDGVTSDVGREWTICEEFKGDHFTVGVIAKSGHVHLCVPLRKDGPDALGSVSRVQLVQDEDVTDFVRRLCGLYAVTGLFGIELVLGADGSCLVYDVNPRISLDMGYYPQMGFSVFSEACKILIHDEPSVAHQHVSSFDGRFFERRLVGFQEV